MQIIEYSNLYIHHKNLLAITTFRNCLLMLFLDNRKNIIENDN